MKSKIFSKHSFLYQYLISFILVLLIPIIVFSFLLKTQISNLLQQEITQNNLNRLQKTAVLFENDLNTMEQIVSQIMLTPDFYSKKTSSKVIELSECQSRLSAYISSGNTFQAIAISWENVPYIYSNLGSCSINLLKTNDPMYPDFAEDDVFNVTLAQTNPLVPTSMDCLLFTYPLDFFYSKQKAQVMFLTEADRYYGENKFSSIANDTYYYIFYGTQLISSNTDYMPFDVADIQTLMDSSEPFSQKLNCNDTEMLMCAIPSAHNDFYFISLAPLETVMAASNSLQQSFIFYVAISSIIALVVIMINLQLNYRPIHNLFYSIRHLLDNNQKHLNEIASIQSAIDNMTSKNKRLLLDKHENMVENILTNLLKGNYSPAKPIPAEDLSSISFNPVYSDYMVCIIHLHKKRHLLTTTVLSSIMKPFFDIFLIKDNNDATISVLINLEKQHVEKLETFRQTLSEYCKSPVTISAGNLYSDIYDSFYSFMEALYTMDYRFIRGNDCVILATDVAFQEDWSEFYPKQDLLKFRRMLSTRNLSTSIQIDEQLNYILNYIRTCDVPMFAARSICFEIINIILSSMSDEELKNNKSYLTHLSHFDTIEEMLNALGMICHNLFTLSGNNTACEADLITQMKIYVDSNYADSNFSLQEMADYFNIGMSNLSQFFKRQTGKTLIEYYTSLRMEQAKTLLADPQNKIDDIALQVGYLNTSSFIRRFKQCYGISPRQYTQELLKEE
ncbi:MAG: helix-turn-helix transcriptional regulator [Lachnospiraceae bacterium]|nr:helix-turn-helix transcriptional regulator [Lachnospiraceae bacterium]